MAGVAGFEPTDARVKVSCLTTWLYPNIKLNGVNSGTRTHDFQSHNLALYQLNYIHHIFIKNKYGTPEGIRTPDTRLRRAVLYPTELQAHIVGRVPYFHRFYSNNGAGDGNRTHATSLEGWCSTIELHPRLAHNACIFYQNKQVLSNIFIVFLKKF